MKYTVKQANKELVTLRQRPMKDGGYSLYLDYTVNGKRVREFLKMYIIPEHNKIDELQNQETLKTANAAKAKRVLALQNGQEGFAEKKRVKKMLLLDYIGQRQEAYARRGSTSFVLSLGNLKKHCEANMPKVSLDEIDVPCLKGFIAYLDKEVSQSTATSYFQYLGIVLNAAKRDHLISTNPMEYMERHEKPHYRESNRCYLTLDEVRRLGEAPCSNQMLKQAFMFACFTGLRLSDIKALRWKDIAKTEEGYQIQLMQTKTKNLVYIPLSENAIAWLPPCTGDSVFPGMPSSGNLRLLFDVWCIRAGIDKHITFHVSRHTFATLTLTYGADLYTVSKLLGHADIATTQIYAKVVDENKRKAVNLIPSL